MGNHFSITIISVTVRVLHHILNFALFFSMVFVRVFPTQFRMDTDSSPFSFGDISFNANARGDAEDQDNDMSDGESSSKGQCLLCSGTSETRTTSGDMLKMVTPFKDLYCHIVHLLQWGEITFKDCSWQTPTCKGFQLQHLQWTLSCSDTDLDLSNALVTSILYFLLLHQTWLHFFGPHHVLTVRNIELLILYTE